jgi:hypothetical protein
MIFKKSSFGILKTTKIGKNVGKPKTIFKTKLRKTEKIGKKLLILQKTEKKK